MMAIKKESIYTIFLCAVLIIVCYFTALRSEDFPDYQIYKLLYDDPTGIEYSYQFISYIVKQIDYNIGFYILLFIYAVLGVFIKNIFIYDRIRNQKVAFSLYLIAYFFVFFPIWDLIQIRYSVGISFLIIGMLCKRNNLKFLYFAASILFHTSMILPISIYLVFFIVENYILRLILIPIFVVLLSYVTAISSYGDKYNILSYGEQYNIITTNSIFVLLMTFFIAYFRKNIILEFRKEINCIFYTAIILFFSLNIMSFFIPSAAFRLLLLVSYLLFICLFFIRAKGYTFILSLITFMFVINYIYQTFFGPNKTF